MELSGVVRDERSKQDGINAARMQIGNGSFRAGTGFEDGDGIRGRDFGERDMC